MRRGEMDTEIRDGYTMDVCTYLSGEGLRVDAKGGRRLAVRRFFASCNARGAAMDQLASRSRG